MKDDLEKDDEVLEEEFDEEEDDFDLQPKYLSLFIGGRPLFITVH